MTATAAEPTPRSEVAQRLDAITEWLAEGCSRAQAIKTAQQLWQVGRRTAQLYLQKVERRMYRAASNEDPLYYQQLGRIQRDHLLCTFNRYLNRGPEQWDAQVLRALASAMNAARTLLDSRDRGMTLATKLARTELTDTAATLRSLAADTRRLNRQNRALRDDPPASPLQARGRVREPAGSHTQEPRPPTPVPEKEAATRGGPDTPVRPTQSPGRPDTPVRPPIPARSSPEDRLMRELLGLAGPADNDPPLGSVAHIRLIPEPTPPANRNAHKPKPPNEKSRPSAAPGACAPCAAQTSG